MAEIKMERKRSSSWAWLVLALLVIAFAIWWMWAAAEDGEGFDTSGIEWQIEVPVEPPLSVIAGAGAERPAPGGLSPEAA